jgi:hypothetical protein
VNPYQIKNTKQLRRAIAMGHDEFRLCLQGGLYSRKTITASRDGRFQIVNHIDESVQKLSARELYTQSNIGRGMKNGALVISQ